MAKKTSKQGKKANRKNGHQAAASGLSSAAVEKPEPVRTEKPAREQPKDREQHKPSKKVEKSAKEQQKGGKGGKTAPRKENILHKVVAYFKNVRLEIKRTTWPSRMDVLRMSLIVVGTLIFFGVLIFILDWVMNWLNTFYAGLVDPAAAPTTDPGVTPDASGTDGSTTTDVPATDGTTTDAPSTSDGSGTSDGSDTPASDSTDTSSDTSTSGSGTTE
jgi:preprotein translocase subunit SecE